MRPLKSPLLFPLPLLLLLSAAILISQAGCLGLVANLGHAIGADQVPADYEGLKGQKVAVITLSDSSEFKDDRSARLLTELVSNILRSKVKEIEVIRSEQVDDWRDENGWDQSDFLAIGRGVGADKVVGITLANLRLREGPNLYKGHADIAVQVFKVGSESGVPLYSKSISDFTYPKYAAQDSAYSTEAQFRQIYLGTMATRIARLFHPYDHYDDVAEDGKFASF